MNKTQILTEKLNELELEILPYLVQGYTSKEIGEIIHISHHTVKLYISRLIKKTNARNRVHAVAILVRAKFI